MKRRILSILGSAVLLCGVITVSTANVSASERELEQVDGSYLTTEEKSTGYISSPDLRGVHLMDGESTISKAGISRTYDGCSQDLKRGVAFYTLYDMS